MALFMSQDASDLELASALMISRIVLCDELQAEADFSVDRVRISALQIKINGRWCFKKCQEQFVLFLDIVDESLEIMQKLRLRQITQVKL